MNNLALLQCIQPSLSKTNVRRMSRIVQAMLSMTGRVTMVSISRWAGKGGSYRTVQRFFNAVIPWPQVFGKFFEHHLCDPEGEYFLVGDECIVTKSGSETYGLDHFFSGLLNKVVKSIGIFSLSLVSVEKRHAYPLRVEQVVRTEAVIKAAAFFDLSNSESPRFIGRAIAALASDPQIMQKSGQVLVAAALGREYGFTDMDGKMPKPLTVAEV